MYTTREIRPGETAELRQMARKNFSYVERLFISEPQLGIVAETENGKIAGGSFLVTAESSDNKIGCIDIIFVLPQYRGSGVGRLLYHEAVELLRRQGCATVMALVRGDNSQSLCRFGAEGLYPVSLPALRRKIGAAAVAKLFVKTASLACATGCFVLCEGLGQEAVGKTGANILRVLFSNLIPLTAGATVAAFIFSESDAWCNLLSALVLICVITAGETIGRLAAGGKWRFILPEGGLIPSLIVALLGGCYPMMGHWYPSDRENSDAYRKRTAAPAVTAWTLLLAATAICGILSGTHEFFCCISDLGVMFLLFYALPFYPFNTFGGLRVRECSMVTYSALVTFSLIVILFIVSGSAGMLLS